MLKAIRRLWTPMVPKVGYTKLHEAHVELLDNYLLSRETNSELSDDNAQLQADLDQALLDRDAALLERDKAIGKFEYVDAAKKELEAKLAERDSYVRFLEGQLKQYMEDEPEDDDDYDEEIEDVDTCDCCDRDLDDCDCDEDEYETCDDCGKYVHNCECGEY